MLTGSLNVLLWLSYVVMLSLYAFAFGSYGATFLPQAWQAIGKHALISLSVITIAGLNLLSAELIGKAESWIVGLKVVILLFFVGVGLAGINTARLAPGTWSPPLQLAAGGMIIFLAYEGFELIANTAQDVRRRGADAAARVLHGGRVRDRACTSWSRSSPSAICRWTRSWRPRTTRWRRRLDRFSGRPASR